MRETIRDKERLEHIRDAIGRIERYMKGVSMTELMADDMRYYAVVKNIEIIGSRGHGVASARCCRWRRIAAGR